MPIRKKPKKQSPIVRGRIDAPYLFVSLWPETDASLRWLWDELQEDVGVNVLDCRVVSFLDGPAEGAHFAPTATQIKKCMPRFRQDMLESAPKIIIPLGAHAARLTTGLKIGIDDMRGYVLGPEYMGTTVESVVAQIGVYKTKKKGKYEIGDPRMGTVKKSVPPPLPANYTGKVMAMYSMQQLQKSQYKLSWALAADLHRAARVANNRFWYTDEDFAYYIRPGVMSNAKGEEWPAASYFPEMMGPHVGFDIETLGIGSDVVKQISMSDGTTTVAFPWTEEVKAWTQREFNRPDTIFIGHNLMFDMPRLEMAGIVFTEPFEIFDTMLAGAGLQPDLPKGLGRMSSMYMDLRPWKWPDLAHGDEDLYSALDSFHTHNLAVHHIIPAMKEVS